MYVEAGSHAKWVANEPFEEYIRRIPRNPVYSLSAYLDVKTAPPRHLSHLANPLYLSAIVDLKILCLGANPSHTLPSLTSPIIIMDEAIETVQPPHAGWHEKRCGSL